MAKRDGAQYQCDRCGKKSFLTAQDLGKSDWHDIKRQSGAGEVQRLYCSTCFDEYRALLERQDADFTAFDNAKRKEA